MITVGYACIYIPLALEKWIRTSRRVFRRFIDEMALPKVGSNSRTATQFESRFRDHKLYQYWCCIIKNTHGRDGALTLLAKNQIKL